MEDNSHAGQGSGVVLDIGGDIGALIVRMPESMEGQEIEIALSGTRTAAADGDHSPHSHDGHGSHHHHDHDDHGHHHHHDHDDHDDDGHHHHHDHAGSARPHVAVVARPTPDGTVIHSLVFPELSQGEYELYPKSGGPTELTVAVRGGEITEAVWPSSRR